MLKKYYVLLLFTYALNSSQCQEIKTPSGRIRGYVKTSHNGRKFLAFEGIPYAQPPIKDRRFKEPEPLEPWEDVLEAQSPTICCQIDMINLTSILGEEECLHLNVYVPMEKPNHEDNMDVIVFIHGGSFLYGSGRTDTDPNYIMDKDIIFVTFNYRLGIFGFLSTEDDIVSGNNGLKDQTMALKWVQKNIRSFGGNPESVTIMGLSAGSASVHLHYFSEMSKGLFHRGFSQSGVALNTWAIQKAPLAKAKILANSLDCPTFPTFDLVECLRKKSFEEILSKEHLFFGYWFIPFTPFAPVVEKGRRPFLKENVYQLLKKEKVLDVPWLVSNTAHEGMFPTELIIGDIERINKEWNDLAPVFFDYNFTLDVSQWRSVSEKIRKFYLTGKEAFTKENPLELAKIFSDRMCLSGTESSIRLQAKANKSPIYFFFFSYTGNKKTVSHGDDKKYFFGKSAELSRDDLKVKDILLDILVSFAKDGKPTLEGVSWEPITYSQLNFLNISGFQPQDIKSQTSEEFTPKKFWKSLKIPNFEPLPTFKDEL